MTDLPVVIVEDELHAVRRLKLALETAGGVDVVGVARQGPKGVEMIRALKPAIAFLDIALPGLSGLEVAAGLDMEEPPVIVFVTAYDRFATEAFRLAAVDYLLKPVDFQQVADTLARARAHLESRGAGARIRDLEQLVERLRTHSRPDQAVSDYVSELWVADRRGAVRVPVASVEWFQADGDYVQIHASGGAFLMRETLQTLESRLDPVQFQRVHRSSIVNLARIARVSRRAPAAYDVVMASGAKVRVGRSQHAVLRALIRKHPED